MQYAFFGADGALDLDAFRLQIGACLRASVQGIAILGLATEVSKLAREERSALLEAASAAIGGRVIDATGIAAGIQNAPEYIGIGLGVESIETLRRNHPNFRVLKAEGSAMLVRRTIEQTQGKLAVLNGRAGLELPDNLRAGCSGLGEVHDRAPALDATAFGLACLERHAARLPAWP